MKLLIIFGLSIFGIFLSTQTTTASPIYNISNSFAANDGGVGTIDINGTITTDGTIGSLGTGNLIDWDLTFSNPGGTQTDFILTPANSDWDISGGATLFATATSLDFTVPVPGAFEFPQVLLSDTVGGPDISWRYSGLNFGTPFLETFVQLDSDGNGPLPETRHRIEQNPALVPLTGDLTGTATNGPPTTAAGVPEPSTWALLTLAGIGFGGFQLRKRGNKDKVHI